MGSLGRGKFGEEVNLKEEATLVQLHEPFAAKSWKLVESVHDGLII